MSKKDKKDFSKIKKAAENLIENRTFEKKENPRDPKEAHFQGSLEENEPFACPRFLEIESKIYSNFNQFRLFPGEERHLS